MTRSLIAAAVALSLPWIASAKEQRSAPTTVPNVDLQRYLGTWYDVASFPQRFQKGCTGTTANYSLREDGQLEVVNRCFKESLDGPEKVAKGRARVVDRATNSKLEVTFFWPFWGDYWILELDPEYRWAIVGSPDREYLWILSRTPQIPDALMADLKQRITAQGFDVARLQLTPQRPAAEAPVAAPAPAQ